MNKLVIAAAGVSRSGKNSFCDLIHKKLENLGFTVKQHALANQLKADLYFLIQHNLNIDVYKCNDVEKQLIRPILVEWGRIRRIQSKGIFWTNLVEQQIVKSTSQIQLISDLRYDFYPEDELFWLKKRMNGILVHIKRYSASECWPKNDPQDIRIRREYIKAPNEDEKINDPKLEATADYKVEWPTVPLDQIESKQMPYIDKFLEFLEPRLKELQCGQ